MFRKISAVIVSAEKPAIVKASVGTVGTWISAHEIQFYVGVATLIMVTMQIIVMIPKVKCSLRQMAAEREREREDKRKEKLFAELMGGGTVEKVSIIDRIRRLFRVNK
ncbi:MAG: hypothetical protein LBI35_07270 [Burkholderiales bacterium]|jgi:hypothetical protein|nr:hypothetical protein [Burkholderiales bacterium]